MSLRKIVLHVALILSVLFSIKVFAIDGQVTQALNEREELKTESILSLSEKIKKLEQRLTVKSRIEEDVNEILSLIAKNKSDNLIVWNRYSVFEDEFLTLINNEAEKAKLANELLRQQSESLSEDFSALEQQLSIIRQQLKESLKKTMSTQENLNKSDRKVNRLEQNFTKNTASVTHGFSSISDELTINILSLSVCIVMLFIAILWLRYRVYANSSALSGEIINARTALDGEYNTLDLKLTELLEKWIQTETVVDSTSQPLLKADHSLPLKVATEIHRMRKRIISMPSDTKGIKPLSKALERLEENLAEQGYSMIDMQGQKYTDGMTVNQDVVMSEDLPSGEKIITKVVRPQVNFQDEIIQVADVVVSVGE